MQQADALTTTGATPKLASERPTFRTGASVPRLLLHDLAATLFFAVATLAFFWPMLRPFPPRMYVVDGDFSRQFFPYRWFAAQEWWAGRIPLWNPDVFAGHPFQADPQSAVFYPLALLDAVVFGRHGLPFAALEGEIVVHTFLAAIFTYALATKLTGSRLGGLVAGIAFGFGGFVATYPAQQLAVLESAIWLPLIVLLLEIAVEKPVRWPALAGASLAFALALLAGHTQTALFIAYAAEGYLLWRLWNQRVPWRRALIASLGFPLGAAALAAIQLLPTIEFIGQSSRATMEYATAAHGYLPSALWQVFVPLWHGEKALSIGVAALALALIGALASRREPIAYWLVIALLALLLSTGGATSLFWLLYHVAPGWSLFKDQERVIYLFSFGAALLAARGVAAIQTRHASQGRDVWWIGAAAGAAVAFVLALGGPLLGEPDSLRLNLWLDAGVLAGLTLALLALARRPSAAPAVGAAIVLVVTAEAFAINFGNNLAPVSPDPRPRLAASAQFMRQLPEPFRVRGVSEDVFPSNYGALLGTPTIGGDSPIVGQRLNELLNSDADWRVWQILNVKFFLSDGGPLAGLKLVFHDGKLNTYAMEDSLPRAWAVTAAEIANSPAEARQMILAPGYHPGNFVVVEQPLAGGPVIAGPRPDVQITHLDAQRVDIDANAAQNSVLVLANQYYPDWRAYRDGQSVPTYRANYLAMAFDLPPGRHHFAIVYQPTSFYVGAAVSAIAVLIAFLLIFPRWLTALSWKPRFAVDKGVLHAAWWVSIVGLLGIAFALRVHDVGLPNITGDEWFMLRNHDEGPLWIIRQAHDFEPHPLVYYLGLAGWIELAGRSEFALRFPSVASGVVLTAALIAFGRTLVNEMVGLLAGLLGAINPYQIAESQNARNYELVVALSALASVLFLRALRRGKRADWIAYVATMIAALNVHYDAALVFAAHVTLASLVWLANRLRGRRLIAYPNGRPRPVIGGSWLIATGVVVVTTAAWLSYAAPALIAYHGYFPNPVTIDRVLERSLATFSLGTAASLRTSLLFVGLAALGLAWLTFERTSRALFLGLYVLLPIAAAGVLFLFRPMFDERYLIVLAPGLLVATGVGIERLARRAWLLGALALGGAIVLTFPMIGQTYASALADRGDYRTMARWLTTFGHADDPIVATSQGRANLLGYYYHGPRTIQVLDDPAKLQSALPTLLEQHSGLWLLPYVNNPADAVAFALLNQTTAQVSERWFADTRAVYFAADPHLAPVANSRATLDDNVALASAALTKGPVTPGGAVEAQLAFDVTATTKTPKLSLRLLDDTGVVAQSDALLTDAATLKPGRVVARLGVFASPVAPPGSYVVAVLPYDPDSGQPLRIDSALPRRDGALILGTVTVGVRERPVAPDLLGFDVTEPHAFSAGVTALGHDPPPASSDAGSALSFRVLWRADRASLGDLTRRIDLRDQQGRTIAQSTAAIVPSHPTSTWRSGDLLADTVRMAVPAAATGGSYTVWLAVGASDPAERFGTITVHSPDRSFTSPPVARTADARFGTFATLLGDTGVPASLRAGATLPLTLVWQARGTADHGYTVFVHLVDPQGKIEGQVDRPPVDGQRATDSWVAGEFLQDTYAPTLAPTAPSGSYRIEIGMYDPATGARVPVTLADGSASDHVVLATLQVS